MKNVVTRSCAVCKKRGAKRDLLRFVLQCFAADVGGKARWQLKCDLMEKCPGRGAYSHVSVACLSDRKSAAMLTRSLTHSARASMRRAGEKQEGLATRMSVGVLADVVRIELNGPEYSKLKSLWKMDPQMSLKLANIEKIVGACESAERVLLPPEGRKQRRVRL